MTDYDTMTRDEVVVKRDGLQKELSKIYDEAPLTDSKSYALAQTSLKENQSQFFSREELNQMLPESLRR